MESVKKLYMAVTADRYELPVFVSDTALELARITGADSGWISKVLKDGRSVIRVEVEDE